MPLEAPSAELAHALVLCTALWALTRMRSGLSAAPCYAIIKLCQSAWSRCSWMSLPAACFAMTSQILRSVCSRAVGQQQLPSQRRQRYCRSAELPQQQCTPLCRAPQLTAHVARAQQRAHNQNTDTGSASCMLYALGHSCHAYRVDSLMAACTQMLLNVCRVARGVRGAWCAGGGHPRQVRAHHRHLRGLPPQEQVAGEPAGERPPYRAAAPSVGQSVSQRASVQGRQRGQHVWAAQCCGRPAGPPGAVCGLQLAIHCCGPEAEADRSGEQRWGASVFWSLVS